ncbi:MAG: hypothetical protein V7K35_05625 [Nostoc sp.]
MANANIQTVWANDINKLCCKMYENNFGKDSIISNRRLCLMYF